jgi:hypothetical protein
MLLSSDRNKVRSQQYGCGFRSGGYPITSEQGGIHSKYFFDGSKRGQKSQVAVKSSNPLFSLDLINFGSGQSSIFQGD